MKSRLSMWVCVALASLGSGAVRAATDTVLLCYGTNVLRFAVVDGVWAAQSDFANKTNSYGGKSNSFSALASDGRRVFVGEFASTSSRILEFDLYGNYQRVLATVVTNIETMCMSQSGKWVYAATGAWDSNTASVCRYDPVTKAGGRFIANTGTNALGEVLWKFHIPRGIATDADGHLWVSERTAGSVYKFNEADGAYLGKVTGLVNVQALHYSAEEGKIYCTSMSDSTYEIDVATGVANTYTISGLANRLGITQVQGVLCSGRHDYTEVSGYDLNYLTRTPLATVPNTQRQIIVLPRAPIRAAIGRLLVAETVSNRVTRLAVDTDCAVDMEGTFAGGAGSTYGGIPLRSPRGLAAFSNTVYVAEGVAGGRVLKFNKWGTFKSVTVDFSETVYSNCVPAALAVTPDGQTLYVTDAHTLFLAGNDVLYAHVPSNGYYAVNSYGETVYKVGLPSRDVSVFADSTSVSNVAAGYMLLEPRSVAVDSDNNVYCSAWFNKTSALSNATGSVYQFDPAGTRKYARGIGNPSICYFDPSGTYMPAAANVTTPGPGVLFTGNGYQDFFWTAAGGTLASFPKMLDLGKARNYLDLEVVDGRMWYTDPEFGTLWLRTGEATCEAVQTGLFTPTYLTYVPETGPEPAPPGTLIQIN